MCTTHVLYKTQQWFTLEGFPVSLALQRELLLLQVKFPLVGLPVMEVYSVLLGLASFIPELFKTKPKPETYVIVSKQMWKQVTTHT